MLAAPLETVVTRGDAARCKAGQQKQSKSEGPEEVGSELQLEAIFSELPLWHGHNSGIVHQQVQLRFVADLIGKVAD